MDFTDMDFGQALEALKDGRYVTRLNWNGRGQYLQLQEPQGDMTLPFISIRTVDGNLVPWLASQTDLLSDDWSTEWVSKKEPDAT